MNETQTEPLTDRYRGKDYAAESAYLLRLIRKLSPNAKTLLDVACGTGDHLSHLSKELRCQGVDIDSAAIEKARCKVPGVQFKVADMESLTLGMKFDVVTCLFSSIAYVDSVERLEQTVSRIAAHMRPGGLLLIEPWIMPERWLNESSKLQGDELEAAKAQVEDTPPLDRGRAAMEIVVGDGVTIEPSSDAPELGWFTYKDYAEAFRKSNLEHEFEANGLTGRGLFSGVKMG